MSLCGRTALLESVVIDGAPQALEAELRAHARVCARCGHELAWLETERTLFRQRASREVVAALFESLPATRSPETARRRWVRLSAALAASVLVALAAGRLLGGSRAHTSSDESGEWGMSGPVASMPLPPQASSEALCSLMPQDMGFQCGPVISASVLASR